MFFVVLFSCEQEFDIVGTWKIESTETNQTELTELDLRDNNIFNFFGATAWSESEGKSFTFEEKTQVITTLAPPSVLEEWNFQYDWNKAGKLITFRVKNPVHKERIIMPQAYEELSPTKMKWKMNSQFSVILSKQE